MKAGWQRWRQTNSSLTSLLLQQAQSVTAGSQSGLRRPFAMLIMFEAPTPSSLLHSAVLSVCVFNRKWLHFPQAVTIRAQPRQIVTMVAKEAAGSTLLGCWKEMSNCRYFAQRSSALSFHIRVRGSSSTPTALAYPSIYVSSPFNLISLVSGRTS